MHKAAVGRGAGGRRVASKTQRLPQARAAGTACVQSRGFPLAGTAMGLSAAPCALSTVPGCGSRQLHTPRRSTGSKARLHGVSFLGRVAVMGYMAQVGLPRAFTSALRSSLAWEQESWLSGQHGAKALLT